MQLNFKGVLCYLFPLTIVSALLCGCGGSSNSPAAVTTGNTGGPPPVSSGVDTVPFKTLAMAAGCSDLRNRLFVIDDSLVLWDRLGNCPDNSYEVTLYDGTPDTCLEDVHDSIAGPSKGCSSGNYSAMFATINANLDKSDLGLGSGHTVQQVLLDGGSQK